ncbi:hypothetical protein Tco_0213430 [Tanacetum coccineum]
MSFTDSHVSDYTRVRLVGGGEARDWMMYTLFTELAPLPEGTRTTETVTGSVLTLRVLHRSMSITMRQMSLSVGGDGYSMVESRCEFGVEIMWLGLEWIVVIDWGLGGEVLLSCSGEESGVWVGGTVILHNSDMSERYDRLVVCGTYLGVLISKEYGSRLRPQGDQYTVCDTHTVSIILDMNGTVMYGSQMGEWTTRRDDGSDTRRGLGFRSTEVSLEQDGQWYSLDDRDVSHDTSIDTLNMHNCEEGGCLVKEWDVY